MDSLANRLREHATSVRGVLVAQDLRLAAAELDKLAATHAAIRALRDEFAHSALVAGQYSVEGPADESKIAANAQADTFSVCAHQMLRLLGDEQEERGIEVCLGCGKPTATSDCGCPAGTGLRLTTNPEPSARLLGDGAVR